MHEMKERCQENPLQRVDRLYRELVCHYGDAQDGDIRAASKLLLVALEKLQRHGGPHWLTLVNDYLALIKENPDKFERIISCQRHPGKPRPGPK